MPTSPPDGDARAAPEKKMVGGFEIIEKIGQGGMGAVFKARQVSIDRVVALKVLPPRFAKNQRYVTRFLREAQSAAKLDHPHIVHAIDVGHADGYYYFAMEYVEGRNLGAILKAEGRLPERRALEIARDVTAALDCAHQAGIIHRDVKPDNVLITNDGTAKLADLGLARQTVPGDSSVTVAGTALGTPHYISPEQVRGQSDLDGRTDVYSLGATLYHLVVGAPPYAGRTAPETMSKHLTDSLPDPRAENPELSKATAAVIRKAMSKERDERYAGAGKLLAGLERALARLKTEAPAGAAAPTPTPGRAAGAGGKKETWAAIGIAAAALFALAIIAVKYWPSAPRDADSAPPATATEQAEPEDRPRPAAVAEDDAAGKATTDSDGPLLADARKWEADHPGEYRKAAEQYEAALGKITTPKIRSAAARALADVKKRRRDAARRELEGLDERADVFVRVGDYDRAIAVYDSVPEEFADLLSRKAPAAASRLKREVEGRIQRTLGKARTLAKAGRPVEAIAELDNLSGLRYAGLPRTAIEQLREQFDAESKDLAALADKRARDSAKQALRKLLANVEQAVARGDLKGAAAVAETVLEQKWARRVKAEALATAAVGKLLPEVPGRKRANVRQVFEGRMGGNVVTLKTADGVHKGKIVRVTKDAIVLEKTVVEGTEVVRREVSVPIASLLDETLAKYRVPWRPADAHEAVAAAILALAEKDADQTEAVLARAEDHPLYPRYRWKLAELKRDPREAAAMRFWEDKLRPLADLAKLHQKTAGAGRKTLAEFRRRHGATEFAESIRKDLTALAIRIAHVLGGDELAKVQGLFKGTVLEYDPGTRRIKLFYDFRRAEQAEDWLVGMWQRRPGDQARVQRGALRLSKTRMQVLMKARFTSVTASADFRVKGGSCAATLLVCADGWGNHYEVCGLWKHKDRPVWRCHLCKYVKGKHPQREADQGKWPTKPSPFALTRQGTLVLSFDQGRLTGKVGTVTLAAEDHTHKAGMVGIWAHDAHKASFTNVSIMGTLDADWLRKALARAGPEKKPAPPEE